MPVGQYVGPRVPYLYSTDVGEVIVLLKDATLGDIPECGLERATTQTIGNATPEPTRFKPRVVFWQGQLDGQIVRKELVCAANSPLYISGQSLEVNIDGVLGSTTGRRGEQQTFLKVPVVDPPPP